jgi:hypothetical protein
VRILKTQGIKVSKTAWTKVNKRGLTSASFHIYAETSAKLGLEIVARSSEESGKKRKCEIFGDEMKGLRAQELEKVLKTNPTKQFLPT